MLAHFRSEGSSGPESIHVTSVSRLNPGPDRWSTRCSALASRRALPHQKRLLSAMLTGLGRCRHISAFTCATGTRPGDPRVGKRPNVQCGCSHLLLGTVEREAPPVSSSPVAAASQDFSVLCTHSPRSRASAPSFPRLCCRPTANSSGELHLVLPKHSSRNTDGSEVSAVKHHVSEYGSQDGVYVEGRGIRDLSGGFSTNP